MQVMRILGRSLVDCFCRYAAPLVFPGGDYWPAQGDLPAKVAVKLEEAMAAIQAASLVEARRRLESVLRDAPTCLAARILLAAVLSDLGRTAAARELLEGLHAECPGDGRLLFLAGQLAERSGEVERAMEHYRQAMSRGGRSACESAERLAAILLATEDYPEARRMLEWLVEARPEEFCGRLELASVLVRLGDAAAAVGAYEDAILMDPDNWEARKDYAATLEAEGRQSEALAELRLLLDEHPEFADLQLRAAKLSGRLGDLRGALRHVDAALKINPRYLDAIVLKGLIFTEQGTLDAAISTFHRALEVNEEYTTAYVGLALALERAGRQKEGAETMELARAIAPSSEQIYARMARIGLQAALAVREDRGGARGSNNRRIDSSISSVSAISMMPPGRAESGISSGSAARPAPAGLAAASQVDHGVVLQGQLEMHRAAIEKHPNYADMRYYYGLLLASLGRTEEALLEYRAAVEINPRYVEALVRLALGYWQLNRTDEALHALEKAQDQAPGELRTYYRFGLTWADRGLWPMTVEALEGRVAAGDPETTHSAMVSAMQNLGLVASRSVDYLSSLNLVDARDQVAESRAKGE
jgi:tetratricopeptide (TPR) repeat protein